MTNRERYKQAFSAIHTSDNFSLEVEQMEKTVKQHRFKAIVASVAACVMLVGGATAAYAMDVGGIQRTLQLWMHGDQQEVRIQFDGNGNYNMTYSDEDGNETRQGGGGVAFEADGTEVPLSEEELIEQLQTPEVAYEEDGSVWVYWGEQEREITDQFENGICYVQLVNGEEMVYMTIKYQEGYATSSDTYPSPASLD